MTATSRWLLLSGFLFVSTVQGSRPMLMESRPWPYLFTRVTNVTFEDVMTSLFALILGDLKPVLFTGLLVFPLFCLKVQNNRTQQNKNKTKINKRRVA